MNRKPLGSGWTRAVLIQLAIIVALAAVLKFYLPGMEKRREAAVVREREARIQAFARSTIVDDTTRDIPAGPDAGKHPQKLLRQDTVDEVQTALGAPTSESRDFRGGDHLTWIGTDHRIEAAFDKGVLYNVMYADIRSGHGVTVYESSAYWQTF
jgi:hypothetical protein